MDKLLSIDEFMFNLYDVNTAVIYNDESVKNKIVKNLEKTGLPCVNSSLLDSKLKVRDFLKSNHFKMKYIPLFKIEDILTEQVSDLIIEEQLYLKIIIVLSFLESFKSPAIIFDDVLSFLPEEYKKIILKFIKEKNITLVNFTSDVEEVLYSKYLIVLSTKGVAVEGSVRGVLKEEKILKRMGFSLPFVFDLALQLKEYGLVDKEYYSISKLVNDLWK